jgi:2-oxoglutarate dehydrogenase complex dehydrogenase (E1) component-like enzyme
MLRSARFYKHHLSSLEKVAAVSHVVTSKRAYNYQKDIYLSDFRSSLKDASLREQLDAASSSRAQQASLYRYINAYHKYGYRFATLNPIEPPSAPPKTGSDQLSPARFGLNEKDSFPVQGLLFNVDSAHTLSLPEITNYLNQHYSNNIAIEFDFLHDEEEKLWLNREYEKMNDQPLDASVRVELLRLLSKSQVILMRTSLSLS